MYRNAFNTEYFLFRVSSTANTATAGVDFNSIVNQTVIFGPGDSSKPLIVTIKDDSIVETDEVFTLRLSTAAGFLCVLVHQALRWS